MLGVGSHFPPLVARFFDLNDTAEADIISARFERASKLAYDSGWMEREATRARLMKTMQFEGKNIAIGCRATQSSALAKSAMTPEGAINGVRTGRFGFHTDAEAYPWWMVDLGGRHSIDEIVVFNRLDGDCAMRARSLVISISIDCETWSELHRNGGTVFGGLDGNPLRVRCPGTIARFVRLKLDTADFLHLDQVEIYSLV